MAGTMKALSIVGGLLAGFLFFLCLGQAILALLIVYSMHTRGNFHGIIFPVKRTLYTSAIFAVASIAFLAFAIRVLRRSA